MEKVYLEVDAKTGKLKSKLKDGGKHVQDFGSTAKKATNQAESGLKGVEREADKLNKTMSRTRAIFGSALALGAITKAGKAIVTTGDAVREMDARLRVAARSNAEFVRSQEETFKIAQRTHSAIGETVDLYSRLALALKDTNVTQTQTLRITETINKAFVVSGATAQEASNAIRQLSQSMASGVLRGDEYRSVNEQGARIISALATSLNKTRGELKAMADTGQLTSRIVIDALLEQSAVIDREFSEFPVTVSRALADVGNAWTKYISESQSAMSISAAVSNVLITVAENMDLLIDSVLTLTQVLIALAGGKVLGAVIASLTKTNAVTKAATAATYSYGASMTGAAVQARNAATATTAFGSVAKGVLGFLKSNALGLAIFGGIELIQFLGRATEEAEKFRQQNLPEAVKAVSNAFSEGINVDSFERANQQAERLRENLAQLKEQERNLVENRTVAQSSFKDGTAQAYVFELKNIQKEAAATEEALGRLFIAEKVVLPLQAWLDKGQEWIDQQEAQKRKVEETNATVEKWITTQQEQVTAMTLQNQAFGKGKAALAVLQAQEVKNTTTSEKYKKQIDEVTAAKVAQIERNEELLAQQKRERENQLALQEEYDEVIEAINNYREAVDPILDAEIKRSELLAKARNQLDEGKLSQEKYNKAVKAADKILEDATKAQEKYAAKVRSADDVLEDMGATTRGLDADILLLRDALEQAKAAADADRIDQLTDALKRLEAQSGRSAAAYQGIFGNGINDFGSLLGNAFGNFGNGGGQGFFGTLSQGFSSMFSSGESAAAGIGQITGAIGQVYEAYTGAAGKDTAGQLLETATAIIGLIPGWGQAIAAIAQAIDAVTGGKLFGTAFEVTGGLSFIDVGNAGASGFTQTFEERERSLFRGTERRTTESNLSAEAQASIDEFFDSLNQAVVQAARAVGATVGDLIEGSFTQEFDKNGNLTKEFGEILGRVYEESFEQFAKRLTAENLIATVGSVLPEIATEVNTFENILGDYGEILATINRTTTVMTNEAQQIAERWRDQGADVLLEGAQLLVAAVADIQKGKPFFETLTQTVDVIEALNVAGETLVETYALAVEATAQLDQGLLIMGQSLDLSQEAYVTFATEIARSVGGIDRARELWSNFFREFYEPEELNAINLGQARDTSDNALAGIGLDPETTMAEFREAFESVFSTLTADEVATWLEAGEALSQYNAILAQQVDAVTEANQAFAAAIQSVNDDILGMLRSDFQNVLAQIERQEANTIRVLNELAIAAGQAGASEEELARVHLRTAMQTERAIAQLRNATISLIDQLYGSSLDDQIAELEAAQFNQVSSVGQAAENTYERQLALLRRIQQTIDATRIDEALSPLTRVEQLAEAQMQFDELVALAQTGDTEALAQLPGLYQELLSIGRDVFASGQGYTDLFNNATNALEGLGVVGGPGVEVQTGPIEVVPSAQLQALYEERDARLAAQEAAHRLELATQLTTYLTDLANAVGTPVLELASNLGVSMEALVTDLGVNLNDVSIETATALADISNLLGVELVQLADSVGVSLGALSDSQSLLNDALESRVLALPEEFRNQLTPLLRAVETAADGTERDAALAALESATADLPVEYRNALAPFFESIDPISELDQQLAIAQTQQDTLAEQLQNQISILASTRAQETALNAQTNIMQDQRTALTAIRSAINSQNSANGLPSFDVGSARIPRDMIAQVHKDEIIINPEDANILRKYGIRATGGEMSNNRDIVVTLQKLIEVVAEKGEMTVEELEELNQSLSIDRSVTNGGRSEKLLRQADQTEVF